MKQKIYILGVVTTLIVFTGILFKLNHWPGAGYLLIIGLVTLVMVFMPVALINHYKGEGNRQNLLLHVVTWLTCFVIFISMLFKIQHWSGAGILMTIALPFPYVVFLPVFLVTSSKNQNFNINNTVFVLLLLALNSVFSALLSLNVSRARINDSYNLTAHYNKLETSLGELPVLDSLSPIYVKIDEALKVVNEYKDLILQFEGTSDKEWENGKGDLRRPDSGQASVRALSTTGNARVGEKLDNSLKALVKEIENTPGCEALRKAIPAMLDLVIQDGKEPSLNYNNITNTLVWSLIYLDGLETNLKMIKATVAAGN
jgi:hypothetical protein